MKGALPPSSSESRLSVDAEACARCLPTGVDPVKESLRTRESFNHGLTTAAARSRDAGTTLMTPAGMPALAARNASASADNGVSSAGLAITVQPAARAGAILRASMAIGKFHGVIAAATPTGSLVTMILRP